MRLTAGKPDGYSKRRKPGIATVTNRFFIAVFAAVLLVLGATPAAADWASFTDPDGVFALDVPQTPQLTEKDSTTGQGIPFHLKEYGIDMGDIAMLMMVGDYSGKNVDAVHAVDDAVSGVESDGTKLLTNEVQTIDGHQGRRVTWRDSDGDFFTNRIFFFDDHLYQVITVVGARASDADSGTAERFSGSLHFLR